jgi:hypothetical protein
MIDKLVRDFQVLRRADFLIGKIWVDVLARRAGLFAIAVLIAAFGVGMANLAGLHALEPSVGTTWAACLVAVVDLFLAAIVMILARSSKPGPEIELALDVRKMAIEALQSDTRDVKAAFDAMGQEVRDAKQAVLGVMHHPLDAAAEKLLIPAAISIIRGLRGKKSGV